MADTKTNIDQENKEKRRRMIEDGWLQLRLRLDNLPESLQFHILTLLNTKEAVQISMLSKQWLSIWTSNPVLHLNCSDFRCVDDFDKFVSHVLRHRDHSAELNTLTFTRRGFSSRNFVKEVLDYAISHGVNHLKLSIKCFEDYSWDITSWVNRLHTSSNSLKTLKLKSQSYVGCPLLSGSFKNLTVLHLKGAIIGKDHKPFLLGFPTLEKLVLKDCYLGKILRVKALKLSALTISNSCFNRCELTTPNLRVFKYTGSFFQELQTNAGLPALDTVVIDSNGFCNSLGKRRMIEDVVSLFQGFGNAKSVTLSTWIVCFLIVFQEKLKELDSPFSNLKCLNMDVRQGEDWGWIMHEDVKAYLLKKSPLAKFNIIHSSKKRRVVFIHDGFELG